MANRDRRGSSSDSLDAAAREEAEMAVFDPAAHVGFRRIQIHLWLLFEDSSYSRAAKVVQTTLLVLILVSTSLILVEAEVVHPCRYECELIQPCQPMVRRCDAPQPLPLWMFVVDTVCIAAFTAELLLRTVAAPATIGLRRFLCSPANWVDVAAILPYFLELPTSDFVPRPDGGEDDGAGGVAALSVLRVIRLARLARVLKVSRSMTGFLVLLRTIGKSLVPLGMLMVFVLSMSIFFTIVIGEAERGEYYADWEWKDVGYFRANGDRARFLDFGTAWWWCLQTLTSVGYGDLFPLTPAGYVIGSLAAVVGTIVLALPITIIGATFDDEYEKARKKRHFEATSRVCRYNAASRMGTRAVEPPRLLPQKSGLARLRRNPPGSVSPETAPTPSASSPASTRLGTWTVAHQTGPAAWPSPAQLAAAALAENPDARDEKFSDQLYNAEADISCLLTEHFAALREKASTHFERNLKVLTESVAKDVELAVKQHNELKDDLRKRDIRNSRMTGLTPDGRRPSQEQTPSKDEVAAINRAASGADSGGGAIVGAWRKAATVAPAATPQPPPAESSPVVPVDPGEG